MSRNDEEIRRIARQVTLAQVGTAGWTAGLDTTGYVPKAQLGSGAPSSANFLRGDGQWAVPAGGSTPTGTGWVHVTGGVQDAAATTPTAAEVGASPTGHTHSQLHDRSHLITSGSDHTFPGGGTFLRADGTFAAPGAGEAFPVGAVFIAVVSTNPNTLLGYGTWSAFAAGRGLVGLNSGDTDFDVVEETGGAKTVTLSTAEIPSHTHVQDAHNHTQDSHNHTQNQHTHTQDAHSHTQASTTTATGAGSNRLGTVDTSSTAVNTGNATATNQNATATNQAATATNQAATATNQNTGGGGAHNNVQPYIVVYMWKRTA